MRIATLTLFGLFALELLHPGAARAQAGPPFLTNDPGTPGNANWEINLASMQTISRGVASYQVPQIDLNYGLGDRIQLTFQIPYVVQSNSGQPTMSGWSNALPGIKWRFLDEGDKGWQLSTFPQIETGTSASSREKGIASLGPRYLLPLEVARQVGPLDIDFEVGYYFPNHGLHERILGFVVGAPLSQRLELYGELYDDHADGGPPHDTTLDLGGRYKLRRGVIALFMAGRSINGFSDGQPEFMGYIGIQILLSNYGRTFTSDPESISGNSR